MSAQTQPEWVRLRYLADFNPPVPTSVRNNRSQIYPLLPMDSINDFTPPSIGEEKMVEELLSGYSYIEPTDVAYAKVTPCFENGKGLVGSDLDRPTFATTELTVIRPEEGVHQRFLSYFVQSHIFREEAISSMTGAGGLRRVSEARVRDLKVPLPSKSVQREIVNFLDREIAEIDEAISDQVTLSRLLEERNDTHITTAVTPSGGTCGWRLIRLKRVADLIGGLTYEPADIVPDSRSGSLVVRAGNVQGGELVVRDPVYVGRIIPEALRLRRNDIVVCARNGSAELVGKNALVTEEFVGETWGAFMMVVRSNLNPYLRWVLNSRFFSEQAGSYATTTINQLTVGTLGDFEFWLPPLEVQVAIDRELRKAVETNKQVMSDIQRAISLAKERRAALITAAVTGQIDVTAKNKPVAEQLEDELAEAR